MKEGGTRLRNLRKYDTEFPLVTVITVTYNAGSFLEKCIESVTNQSYPNIEQIILDGGSTDRTLAILEERNDTVTYWKSEPDQGIYDAMNKAIKYAEGEWILFLGADDTLLPGFSEMAFLLKDKNCIYYGESLWQNNVYGGEFTPYRLSKSNICHQNIFYPKAVFMHYEYDSRYKVYADHYLNILCFGDKRFRFEFHQILVAVYATGGFSSQNTDMQFALDKTHIIKENLGNYVYLQYKFRQFRHFIKGKK